MHEQFLNLLCCPQTREPLRLVVHNGQASGLIISGELISTSGKKYPIVRGIPRFVAREHYSESFGYEWNHWPRVQFESENVGRPMAGHTLRMWETITGAPLVKGRTLVEFGCGSGRFLDIVRSKGGRAVGIDLSSAVEAARSNLGGDPQVLVVQGDILKPPFADKVFDGGFTIGVLHHTPCPLDGLKALVRTVCNGGWIACSVYPNRGFYASRSVGRYRRLNHHLKPMLGYKPALAYSYISSYALAPLFSLMSKIPFVKLMVPFITENWVPCLHHLPDGRWRVLDVFDAITPEIATTHTGEEVASWMKLSGISDVGISNWGETSVVGFKKQKYSLIT